MTGSKKNNKKQEYKNTHTPETSGSVHRNTQLFNTVVETGEYWQPPDLSIQVLSQHLL